MRRAGARLAVKSVMFEQSLSTRIAAFDHVRDAEAAREKLRRGGVAAALISDGTKTDVSVTAEDAQRARELLLERTDEQDGRWADDGGR